MVTKLGVTGTGSHYDQSLKQVFTKLHTSCDLPAIAGFGISDPKDAIQIMARGADGVIVGSKLIELLSTNSDESDDFESIRDHTRSMLQALDQ